MLTKSQRALIDIGATLEAAGLHSVYLTPLPPTPLGCFLTFNFCKSNFWDCENVCWSTIPNTPFQYQVHQLDTKRWILNTILSTPTEYQAHYSNIKHTNPISSTLAQMPNTPTQNTKYSSRLIFTTCCTTIFVKNLLFDINFPGLKITLMYKKW